MRNLFRSKHRITQEYGVNKDYYSKFGLQGHEGLDLVPTGTDWTIYALEDGVVVKDEDNARSGAYGVYCTIWHPSIKRATQYCHLEFNLVELGMQVKKGQAIGKMGSTGNSTGPHVHLNLFNVDDNGTRLNKDNGFLGGINPLPFLEEEVSEVINTNDTKKAIQFDRVLIEGHKRSIFPDDRSENWLDDDKLVNRLFDHIDTVERTKRELEDEVSRLKSDKADLSSQITTLNNKYDLLLEAEKRDTADDNDLISKNLSLEKQVTELNKQIDELKQQKDAPVEPVIKHYDSILEQIWPNLIKGKKAKSLIDKFWEWVR